MTAARTVIAALAAPLLSPAFQTISLYVLDPNLVAKYFLTYSGPIAAYLTPFMLGLPVYMLLWRLGWGKLRTYIVAGFLVGALTAPLIAIATGSSFFALMIFPSGTAMLAVAVTFWLIARPDRYRRASVGSLPRKGMLGRLWQALVTIYLLGFFFWLVAMQGSMAYGPLGYYGSGRSFVYAAEVAALWPVVIVLSKFGIKLSLPFAPVWDTNPATPPQQIQKMP